MRLPASVLLSLAIPLSAQGIFNNASKPGDPICSRSTVGTDAQLEFGSGAGTHSNAVGGSLQNLGSAPTSANTGTGGAAGGTRTFEDLYTKGHISFDPGKRLDASAFTAYGKDGKPVSIASLKGKIVVVGFWSYHCEPSARMVMEMAQLLPRKEKFGFEILAVNYDASRMPDGSEATGGWAAVRSFELSNRDFFKDNPFPFFIPGTGKEGAINFINQVDSLPLLAVVDRDGKLASLDSGYHDKEVGMRISQLIKEEQAAKTAGK